MSIGFCENCDNCDNYEPDFCRNKRDGPCAVPYDAIGGDGDGGKTNLILCHFHHHFYCSSGSSSDLVLKVLLQTRETLALYCSRKGRVGSRSFLVSRKGRFTTDHKRNGTQAIPYYEFSREMGRVVKHLS